MMYKQSPKINSNEQRMNQIHRNYVAADYNQNYSNNLLNSQMAEKMMIAYKHQKSEKKPLVTKKIRMVDPFSNKYQRDINSFAYVYEAGGIPCKINYNTQGNMKIQWIQDVNIQTIPYDPVLVTCFNGLLEDVHPYLAIATTAIQFMLQNEAAQEKIIYVLPKLVLPLRSALSSKSDKVFGSAIKILMQALLLIQVFIECCWISSEQISEIVPSPYLAEIESFSFRRANQTMSYCFGKQWGILTHQLGF
ncbi:unnamed protein product (macronuclear) [Paramecium tetraurelia]|uniref:Uncharacterized protein n=1 Tax=Paramecium tetraurelia TaxID=5888 RepID=A0E6P9_PARTE|nr:uncharacterized protein GSPATT00023694001 [Paramecium tetraurelia]CAK90966.1 unnamed protein product [Paramecium tetraurelia]|eukprot:XP_001458363.1 hypothetical protein (macronuclear) [Paramecium tetraurelia strain d4-2]